MPAVFIVKLQFRYLLALTKSNLILNTYRLTLLSLFEGFYMKKSILERNESLEYDNPRSEKIKLLQETVSQDEFDSIRRVFISDDEWYADEQWYIDDVNQSMLTEDS
jgi:hypothetical protein